MRTRSVVLKEYQDKQAEQKGILEKGDALSVEDVTKAEALDTEIEALAGELKQFGAADEIAKKAAQRAAEMDAVARPTVAGGAGTPPPAPGGEKAGQIVPAYRGSVRSFKGATKQEAALKAYRFGMFCFAALTGSEKAARYCKENGIPLDVQQAGKGQREGENAAGGFLVPDEFENDLIDLREEFGIFRRLAKKTTMTSDTKSVPRRTGGLTAYPVGEGQAAAQSQKGWDRVSLTAKKIMVLAKYSSELDEDAVIDTGDDLAEEIAYAFAVFEDDCGFVGDGTGAYHRIVGVTNALRNVDATVANVKGLVVASGNAWSEFTLEDFHAVKARLPRYARRRAGSVAWHCHQSFYYGVMERLMLASGGVTAAEVAAGRDEPRFMGHPVEITQSMPDAEANSQIPVTFGALDLAAMFGDRRQTAIAMSSDLYFAEDEIAIRGTERFDINVHDVGDTAKPGPVVGLISAAA